MAGLSLAMDSTPMDANGQGGLIRERFARAFWRPAGQPAERRRRHLDPDRIWAVLMHNEKPGGHGSAVLRWHIDMAVWDAVCEDRGHAALPAAGGASRCAGRSRVFVYAAGGYYYPAGPDCTARGDAQLLDADTPW